MSKILLPTKYGGIPYLNDHLLSKLNYQYVNLIFGEFADCLDIFDKYYELKKSNTIIKDYFNIDKQSILNLFDNENYSEEYGSSDINSINIKSSKGKVKLLCSDYIKYIQILKPTYSILPFEFINENNQGDKKYKRNFQKAKAFIEAAYEKKIDNTKFLVPAFIKNQLFSFDNMLNNEIALLRNYNLFGGLLIFNKSYSSFKSIEECLGYIETTKTSLQKLEDSKDLVFQMANKIIHPSKIINIIINSRYAN